MLCGSSARLIARIRSTASPCSATSAFELVHADAVLAGAGSAHRDGAQADALRDPLGLARARAGSFGSNSTTTWKLPSPTWPTIGATSPVESMSARVSRMQSASREIGTQASVANPCLPGRQRQRRVVRRVARLPQPRAVLGLRRPLERAAAVLRGDRLHRLGLLAQRPPSLPWNSKNSVGFAAKPFELRIADARPHLQRRRGARCARPESPCCIAHDHGVDRAFEVGELAHRRRHRLGHPVEPQLHLGDDPERALGADEKPREVVAGARLARAAAGVDDPAVGGDDGEAEHVLAHRAVADGVGSRGARRRHAADRGVRRPGSIGKKRPVPLSSAFSCSRVTPACTRQSRSSALISSTRFIRERSTQTPPYSAATWPSSDVPTPKAITGTRAACASRTIAATSSVVCGNTTTSGSAASARPSPWPCCSRRRARRLAPARRNPCRDGSRGRPPRARRGGDGGASVCAFMVASSEPRDVRMRELAVVDVHLAEFGAAMQRGHALAGIEQPVRVERGLDRRGSARAPPAGTARTSARASRRRRRARR